MGNKRMVILEVCLFVINVFCATAAAHGGGRPPLPPCPGPCRSRVDGVCVYICWCCDDKACYNPDTSGCCHEGTGKTCPYGKECCKGACCDHSQCEACDGNGHCISGCIASQCEECDGNGHCVSRCTSGNCEGCVDGSCESYCPPGTSCCNGSSCCEPGHPCDGSGGCVDIQLLPWPDQAGPIEKMVFDSNSGVLTIVCRARVSSGSVGSSDISFDCNSVGDSNMTVGPVTMVNGNYLCIITFTGLPTNNDFGFKAVKVYYRGTQVGTVNIEVRFPRYAKNNPGGTVSNWCYYWKRGGVVTDLAQFGYEDLDGYGAYYPGTGELVVRNRAPTSNSQFSVTNAVTGQVEIIGGTGTGIYCCAETCAHELKHKWIHDNWSSLPDRDGDGIPDSQEGIPPYYFDPDNPDTYNLAGTIDPCYAATGDEEFLAWKAEQNPGPVDPNKDWSE